MILRSDTIGKIESPSDKDIDKALYHNGKRPQNNDIVKIEKPNGDYLSAWYFEDYDRFDLTHRQDGVQKKSSSKLTIQEVSRYLKQYNNNDLSFVNDLSWEKTACQILLENLKV